MVGPAVAPGHRCEASRRHKAAENPCWPLVAALLVMGLGAGFSGASSRASRITVRPIARQVRVSLAGPIRAVSERWLGLNGLNLTGPAWNDPYFDAALAAFAPGVIRYPGGTVANYWSWRAGWFEPGNWPGEPLGRIDDKLPVFAVGLRSAHAIPLFDLNTVTYRGVVGSRADNAAMLADQLRQLHAASADGLPVRMVELGNELYQDSVSGKPPGPYVGDYAKRFPTAASYARQMNSWIHAIHRAFREAKVAAVATELNDVRHPSERRRHWNATVLRLLRGEDAVTVHENLVISDPQATTAAVLAVPYEQMAKLREHELVAFAAHHLPVWITEFNLSDHTPGRVFAGTWLNGLFVAEQALLFLGDPRISYAGLSACAGSAQLAAIFNGAQGFGLDGPPTTPLALTATGTTLSVIQRAIRQATSARPLAFSPEVAVGRAHVPAVLGEALTTPAGPRLVVLNLSPQAVTLDLARIFPRGFDVTQVSAASARAPVTGPSSLRRASLSAAASVRVAPYAILDVTAASTSH